MMPVICDAIAKLGNSDAFFWFYSATAQVFVALFAIVGIFVVYRLEDQRRKIKDSADYAAHLLRENHDSESVFLGAPYHEIKKCLKEVIEKKDTKEELKTHYGKILKNLERRQAGEVRIRERRKRPFRLTMLMLILSLILIPGHKFLPTDPNFFIMFILLLGGIGTVLDMGFLIKQMIEED